MKILVIDIETTGFQNQNGKIVEVGIVSLDLENGNIEPVFSSVVHERPITKKEVEESWIVQNGYMTVEEIQNSPTLKSKLEEIQWIVDSYPDGATAFNRAFDFNFLNSRGVSFPKMLPCPMLLATDVCKIPSRNGYSDYKWPKVEEAWKCFFPDIEHKELHRGADDAFHEAKIVYHLYKIGVFKP